MGYAPPSAGGPSPAPGIRTSAIVFAYDNAAGLRELIPEILTTSVDEVVVMYGGTDDTPAVLAACSDPRLSAVFEEERTGKWDAFNRGVDRATGDVVFLVSGDIRLGSEAFPRLLRRIVRGAGVAFPRVEPSNVHSWVTRVGARLWSLRDAQHAEATRLGLTVHGGELQAVRRELLETIPPIINEDAWVCLRAAERGYSVVYERDAVISNRVPETFRDLLLQRTRINFGHFQLWQAGYLPSTLDTLLVRRPGLFVRMFWKSILAHPRELGTIPVLAFLEGIALVRGYVDHRRGRDYTRWHLIGSARRAPA
jgi:cellulose synthase/poly-beta-1,6-N-acetylglucosamine synthase-like glycosyltransferase